jgi:predicted nucleotidyltransferase
VISDIEFLLAALNHAGVRYVVVGGVAVVLHGYLRATADLDLVLAMDEQNLRNALQTFDGIGFQSRAPVPLAAFADASERQRWIDEKNLQVFSLWHSKMPGFEVDLFVESPLPFDDLYARAVRVDLGETTVSVAAIDDLVAMKRAAGRPRDVEDVEALLHLKNANGKRSE